MKTRAVFFDLDGTCFRGRENINDNIWEMCKSRIGTESESMKQRYRDYRAGNISIHDLTYNDIKEWHARSVKRQDFLSIAQNFRLFDGVLDACRMLHAQGVHLFILSGSFDFMVDAYMEPIKDLFTEIHITRLQFDAQNGHLSAWELSNASVHGKDVMVQKLCDAHGLQPADCAFVGDDRNDLAAAQLCGVSIAFNPRCPELEKCATHVLRTSDMRDILPLLMKKAA